MQFLFIILLALFSVGIGLSLGILLMNSDLPLAETLSQKPEIPDQDQEPVINDMAVEEESPTPEKPSPDSELLLQIWQGKSGTILYGVEGEFLKEEDLSEDILSLLEPFRKRTDIESLYFKMGETDLEEALPAEEEEAEVEALSLIDEIDEILQEKLSNSPLSERGIRLTENHKQEITIWVGLESYPSIDDIPDPEIQKIIHESVQDWEKRK